MSVDKSDVKCVDIYGDSDPTVIESTMNELERIKKISEEADKYWRGLVEEKLSDVSLGDGYWIFPYKIRYDGSVLFGVARVELEEGELVSVVINEHDVKPLMVPFGYKEHVFERFKDKVVVKVVGALVDGGGNYVDAVVLIDNVDYVDYYTMKSYVKKEVEGYESGMEFAKYNIENRDKVRQWFEENYPSLVNAIKHGLIGARNKRVLVCPEKKEVTVIGLDLPELVVIELKDNDGWRIIEYEKTLFYW